MKRYDKLGDSIVRTEAMRIARAMVKDELKRQGVMISYVEASAITKAAKHCLNDKALGKHIVRKVKREIKSRERQVKKWAKEDKL